MASATSLINTPTGPKSQITDHLANASVESLQIEHGDGDHIPAVPSSPLDVRPTSSSISEDSIALSLATETSQNESFAFAMEKGFWRVQQGAQELLRFADLYRTRRDGTAADPDFLATGSLPKEIDLVSMTQLSWGVVHAVGDINNHNRKQAESYKWMRDDDKSSHRKHKRSKKKASSDLEVFNACKKCGVMDTPRWRDGPAGPLTLCNVCGLLYAKRSQRHGSGSESYWRRESLGGRD